MTAEISTFFGTSRSMSAGGGLSRRRLGFGDTRLNPNPRRLLFDTDGQLFETERTAAKAARLKRLDTGGDGQVSREEK